MKDLWPLNYFLGISITRDTYRLFLSQENYVIDILQRDNMLKSNPCLILSETISKLYANGKLVADPHPSIAV